MGVTLSSFDMGDAEGKEVKAKFLVSWRGSLEDFQNNGKLADSVIKEENLKKIVANAVRTTLSPEKRALFESRYAGSKPGEPDFDLSHTFLKKLKAGGAVQNTHPKSWNVVANNAHANLNTSSNAATGTPFMFNINASTNATQKFVTISNNTTTVKSDMFIHYGHASAARIMQHELDFTGRVERDKVGIRADSALIRSLSEGNNLQRLRNQVPSWDGDSVTGRNPETGVVYLYFPMEVVVEALTLYHDKHVSAIRLTDFKQDLKLSLKPLFTESYDVLDNPSGFVDADLAKTRQVGTVSFEMVMVLCFPDSIQEERYITEEKESKSLMELFMESLQRRSGK